MHLRQLALPVLSLMQWIFKGPVRRTIVVADQWPSFMVYWGLPCPEGDRASSLYLDDYISYLSWRMGAES
jgi:hypothetical protein